MSAMGGPTPHHVLADTGLTDVDAQLQQFTVEARRTPEWIRGAHVVHERSNGRSRAWPVLTGLP